MTKLPKTATILKDRKVHCSIVSVFYVISTRQYCFISIRPVIENSHHQPEESFYGNTVLIAFFIKSGVTDVISFLKNPYWVHVFIHTRSKTREPKGEGQTVNNSDGKCGRVDLQKGAVSTHTRCVLSHSRLPILWPGWSSDCIILHYTL